MLDAEGRRLRDHFRMPRWLNDEAIRRTYFRRIDWALDEFGQDGIDPPDDAVVALIAIGVTQDDGFESHVLARSETNPDWPKLREVCAKVIYEAYIRAVENGTWPET